LLANSTSLIATVGNVGKPLQMRSLAMISSFTVSSPDALAC
jgi:hypothetical protein